MAEAELVILNTIGELERITGFLEKYGEEWGFNTKTVFSLNLVLEELITNIIFYGYTDEQEHEITIGMQYDAGEITLFITDDGKPFDPLAVDTPGDLDKPLEERKIGGLGIHFVREIMDTHSYERDGNLNRLILSKKVK